MIRNKQLQALMSMAVIALAIGCQPGQATDYFVSNMGDNGNTGLSGDPWETLQHAADQVVAGDTVTVASGSYDGFHMTTSGTVSQRIEFLASGVVTIVSDNGTTPDGINLEGASHVTVDGFTVNGRSRAGIRAVLCDGVILRNNSADMNSRWGIFTGFCDGILIENNITTNSQIEHGIYFSNSADDPVIRNNLIIGNNANGIHMNGDISVGGDGVISRAIVEKNTIINNGTGGGSGINMDGVQDSIIRNNLIYDTHASGISLYRIDGGAPSTGNQVLNNTILVASDGRWGINIQDNSINNTLKNNIIWNDHPFRGAIDICPGCLSGLVSDSNIMIERFTTNDSSSVLDLAGWQAQTGQDLNSASDSPANLFMNAATDDYQLATDSLAIDFGEILAEVTDDIIDTARPMADSHDAGAYETIDLGQIFEDGFESL